MRSLIEPTDGDIVLAEESQVIMPVRVLQVVGAVARESSRYALTSVLVETQRRIGKTDLVAIVATDGRRMVLVEMSSGLFDGNLSVQIPGDVAKAALKIAVKSDDDEPMITLHTDTLSHTNTLTVTTPSGDGVLTWRTAEDVLPFPPYRDIIPDWKKSIGIAAIGINPELLASTLKVVQKVAGAEQRTWVYLPEKADRPLGFEANDGGHVRVLAIVMPVKIDEWTEPPPKPAETMNDPKQPNLPLGGGEAWEQTPIESIGLKPKTCESLVNAGLTTVGKLADYTMVPNRRLSDIKGIGAGKVEEIDNALEKFWSQQKLAADKAAAAADTPAESGPAPDDTADGSTADADTSADGGATDIQDKSESVVREDMTVLVADFGTPGTAVDAVQLKVAPRRDGTWARAFDVYVGPEVSSSPNRLTEAWAGSHGTERAAALVMLVEVRDRLNELQPSKRGKARTHIDELLAKLAEAVTAYEAKAGA